MSFVFRKVKDVTAISESQSFIFLVSIKDCTLRVPNNSQGAVFYVQKKKTVIR